jgi:peroxiredoxin
MLRGRPAIVVDLWTSVRPISSGAMLKVGDKAPDFTLLDQNGEPFTLSESLRRKVWHLIYFYPGS